MNEKDLKVHVKKHYQGNFLIFQKIEVNGLGTHPVYRFLRLNSQLRSKDPDSTKARMIPWAFAKFLVDENGKVLQFYSPTGKMKEVEADIIKNLKKT